MKRTPLRRTPWRRKKRNEAEAEAMRVWHDEVMARGRYRCALMRHQFSTGECGGRLHAHHVAPRSTHPHLRTDPANGAVLCDAHHRWVHEHPREAEEWHGLLRRATT